MSKEALKMALEALSPWMDTDAGHTEQHAAYYAIKQALEQPAQEPVAWMAESKNGNVRFTNIGQSADQLESFGWTISPLYATPPAQEFVCSTGLCHYKPAAPVQDIGVEQDERVFARIEARKNRDAAHKETAQRQWVGLTDEEKQEWVELMPDEPKHRHIMNLINVIEAELKEKNT